MWNESMFHSPTDQRDVVYLLAGMRAHHCEGCPQESTREREGQPGIFTDKCLAELLTQLLALDMIVIHEGSIERMCGWIEPTTLGRATARRVEEQVPDLETGVTIN